jgi:hypothetical protein
MRVGDFKVSCWWGEKLGEGVLIVE